jgi:hypothetical protein
MGLCRGRYGSLDMAQAIEGVRDFDFSLDPDGLVVSVAESLGNERLAGLPAQDDEMLARLRCNHRLHFRPKRAPPMTTGFRSRLLSAPSGTSLAISM